MDPESETAQRLIYNEDSIPIPVLIAYLKTKIAASDIEISRSEECYFDRGIRNACCDILNWIDTRQNTHG